MVEAHLSPTWSPVPRVAIDSMRCRHPNFGRRFALARQPAVLKKEGRAHSEALSRGARVDRSMTGTRWQSSDRSIPMPQAFRDAVNRCDYMLTSSVSARVCVELMIVSVSLREVLMQLRGALNRQQPSE